MHEVLNPKLTIISKMLGDCAITLDDTVETYLPLDDFHHDASEKRSSTYEIAYHSHIIVSNIDSFSLF